MPQTTTLSSVGSVFMPLNPTAKATTVSVTLTSCSTGTVSLYMTLQDPSQPGGSTVITYTLLSCALAVATSNIGGSATAGVGTGLTYSVLSPIGGLLLVSTATNGTIYLSANQSVTA